MVGFNVVLIRVFRTNLEVEYEVTVDSGTGPIAVGKGSTILPLEAFPQDQMDSLMLSVSQYISSKLGIIETLDETNPNPKQEDPL